MQAALAQEGGICQQATMQLEALQKKYAQLERKDAESQLIVKHQNAELDYFRTRYASREAQVLVSLCLVCCAPSLLPFD